MNDRRTRSGGHFVISNTYLGQFPRCFDLENIEFSLRQSLSLVSSMTVRFNMLLMTRVGSRGKWRGDKVKICDLCWWWFLSMVLNDDRFQTLNALSGPPPWCTPGPLKHMKKCLTLTRSTFSTRKKNKAPEKCEHDKHNALSRFMNEQWCSGWTWSFQHVFPFL